MHTHRDPDTIHVTAAFGYQPHHTLTDQSTSVDGQLTDGRQIDLITVFDGELPRTTYVAATHEWLHDRIAVLNYGSDAPPTLVVPVSKLNHAAIGEALRRWLYGRGVDHITRTEHADPAGAHLGAASLEAAS